MDYSGILQELKSFANILITSQACGLEGLLIKVWNYICHIKSYLNFTFTLTSWVFFLSSVHRCFPFYNVQKKMCDTCILLMPIKNTSKGRLLVYFVTETDDPLYIPCSAYYHHHIKL